MSQPILVIVAKSRSSWLANSLRQVVPPFLARGWRVVVHPKIHSAWMAAGLPAEAFHGDPEFAAQDEKPELCLALGGDGTLLTAARHVGFRGTPLLGINLGSLGFLTCHSSDQAPEAIETYFRGGFQQETRTMMGSRVVRGQEVLACRPVLNDAVINKGMVARLMEFHIQVDGADAAALKADGLIVATPTGSTAYSLSAGGPILHPQLDAWVIAAICPHSLTLRPLVVPAHLPVAITLARAEDAQLTLDGQVVHNLLAGDRIEFFKAKETITLLQNENFSFFRLLQEKLHWSSQSAQ